MTAKLIWFAVRLEWVGLPKDRSFKIGQDLQTELSMRRHLRNPKVSLEKSVEGVIIYVETEDLTPQGAAEQVREEMLEASAAVVWETEGTRIEILDSTPSPTQ